MTLHPEIVRHFTCVLVDEFQDIAPIHWDIIKLVLKPGCNLTVVGDPDQSIYKFAGASPFIFEQMQKELGDVNVMSLTENYRSTPQIINIATSLIDKSTQRIHSKHIQSTLENGTLPIFEEFGIQKSEMDWVANKILALIGKSDDQDGQFKPSDIVILARTLNGLNGLTEALEENGIEYSMIGSHGNVMETEEATKLISFLKFMLHSQHDVFLWHLLRHPKPILPKSRIDLGSQFALERGISLWQALQQSNLWLPYKLSLKVAEFVNVFTKALEIVNKNPQDPQLVAEALYYLFDKTGYRDFIVKTYPSTAKKRISKVTKALDVIQDLGRIEQDSKDASAPAIPRILSKIRQYEVAASDNVSF